LADRVVIQCRWCGFLTVGRDVVCNRCGGSLSDATVISGTTTGRGAGPQPGSFTPAVQFSSTAHSNDLPPYDDAVPRIPPRRAVRAVSIGVVLAFFAVAATFIGFVVYESVRKQMARSSAHDELRQILASQPDFRAIGEGSAGPAFLAGPMIQKGNRLYMTLRLPRNQVFGDRSQVGLANVALIVSTNRSPTVVIPEVRGFGSLPQRSGGRPFLTLKEEFATILNVDSLEVEQLGGDAVNGFLVRTFKVVDSKDRTNYMYVSVAPSLRNLVIKCAIRWRDRELEEEISYTLRDVTFDVDDASLEVPPNYTRLTGA
jgi:hypothetical protein